MNHQKIYLLIINLKLQGQNPVELYYRNCIVIRYIIFFYLVNFNLHVLCSMFVFDYSVNFYITQVQHFTQ